MKVSAPSEDSSVTVPAAALLQDPAFQQLARQHWKRPLENEDYRARLKEYCVICGQWCATAKQHQRLMHPEAWCQNVGWTVAGDQALNHKWVYHSWDPAEKKQVVAADQPLAHADAMRLIDQLMMHIPTEGVLKNFKTTRRMNAKGQYKAEVLPYMVSIGLRGESSAICFNALRTLSGSAFMKLIGVRVRPERGQETQLIKQLKQSYMGTTFCEWTQSTAPWSSDA